MMLGWGALQARFEFPPSYSHVGRYCCSQSLNLSVSAHPPSRLAAVLLGRCFFAGCSAAQMTVLLWIALDAGHTIRLGFSGSPFNRSRQLNITSACSKGKGKAGASCKPDTTGDSQINVLLLKT